jgi:hypothetical protein
MIRQISVWHDIHSLTGVGTLSCGVLSKFGNLTNPDHNNSFLVLIFCFMRWARHVACKGEGRKVYRVFVGKPEG